MRHLLGIMGAASLAAMSPSVNAAQAYTPDIGTFTGKDDSIVLPPDDRLEITGGGTTTVGEWSSVKPRIHLRMQVFDQEKNSQKDIEVTLKDFPRLHGRVSQRGSVETKRSQALSAEELVAMFQEALEALVAR